MSDLERKFKAGTFKSYAIKCKDLNGQPFNLQNRTIKTTIVDSYSKKIIDRSVLINSSTNIFALELQTADTIGLEGEFPFEVWISFPNDPSSLQYSVSGKFIIEKSLAEV